MSVRCYIICPKSLEHDILEVIRALVVPFVLHVEDDAFAVFGVGPSEAVGVVVEAVLQLPGFELAVLEVGVALVMCGVGVFVEVAFVVGADDDVESVVGALGALLRGGAGIIRDAVPGAGHEVVAVAQVFERGIGG